MKTERLSEIKKQLKQLSHAELEEICLKLAKFKKDNKEFLNYLLFEATDPDEYANSVKISLQEEFNELSANPYTRMKELRKLLRLLNKHIKFVGLKTIEVELLLWYSEQLISKAQVRHSQKAMYTLLTRQLQKAQKAISRLHEDLQFDYEQQFFAVIDEARLRVSGFDAREFAL